MENISSTIQTITEEILRKLGIQFDKTVITQRDDSTYRINILTQDASIIIGHFGETLKALQYILKSIISDKHMTDVPLFIICDVEGYKERQEEKVIDIAKHSVEKLQTSDVPQHLPPMSPYFRKVVHMFLMNEFGNEISTHSEGEDDDRHIVIEKKK